MPMYEYVCLDCGKEALLALSLSTRTHTSAWEYLLSVHPI